MNLVGWVIDEGSVEGDEACPRSGVFLDRAKFVGWDGWRGMMIESAAGRWMLRRRFRDGDADVMIGHGLWKVVMEEWLLIRKVESFAGAAIDRMLTAQRVQGFERMVSPPNFPRSARMSTDDDDASVSITASKHHRYHPSTPQIKLHAK